MKLLKLKLQKFKGIKELDVNIDGENIAILGDNATGKTTIADAFSWLLFGKDSKGRAKFGIKTLDSAGNVIHNLEHGVYAMLEIDGDTVELERVYKEKWTKKRGTATATFSGHIVDFFVNNVPKKEKEYTKFIESIIDENMFKLLTSTNYFNEVLNWADRRKMLITAFGDVEDADVLKNSKYNDLVKAIGKNSVDEYNKVIAAEKKKINKELSDNSVRIDEVSKSIVDYEDIEIAIADLKTQSDAKYKAIANLRDKAYITKQDAGESQLKAEYNAKVKKLNEYKTSFESENAKKLKAAQHEYNEVMNEVNFSKKTIQELIESIKTLKHNKTAEEQRIQNLVAEYNALPKFEYTETNECPTCGQPLPPEQIADAREKAKNAFNENRSRHVNEINERGHRAKKEVELLTAKISENTDKKAVYEQKLEDTIGIIERLKRKIESINELPRVTETAEYKELHFEAEKAKQAIETPNDALNKQLAEIDEQIKVLQAEADELGRKMLEYEVNRSNVERVNELQAEQQRLSARYEELEKLTYLMEDFTREKVKQLEDKISANFKYARFKMYDEQINGGLAETCDVMADNVPYTDLNNAAKINIGLDIINTFSRQASITAPIFIDNAEAVTKFIDTDSQVIKLVVDSNYKELEIKKGA
ncbi:AAA family ATPase [Veillonella sp.]|uniref:AAA family ATPase n=1 Tax=Veillonella sp. TaxID=1926307 RepID=UPI0025FF5CE5|nr:AAA family ATPase [Veillonella sp.]